MTDPDPGPRTASTPDNPETAESPDTPESPDTAESPGSAAVGPDRWPGELESNLRWQPPVVVAAAATVVLSGLLLRERPPGWPAVLAVVVLLLATYLLVVWLRTRARMAVRGQTLTVRRWRSVLTVQPGEVEAVRQRLSGHGPDFLLRTGRGRVLVPASRMRRGHSTFFEWLLAGQDETVLDKGTSRTLDVVRRRGLISR